MRSLSVSVVKSTTKTNLSHNNREMTENEMRTNQHINQEKSSSNLYLVKENIEDLYEREFGQALENYNDKQKRSDRKIDNYYDHISESKKTATQQEMIFQIGTAEDFENGFDRDIAVDILEKSFNDFQERNPQLKIFNAVIHNDEATPHLHINFVPVAEDYKRGLEKQVAFDRAIIQQDPGLDKNRPFENWRAIEVSKIEDRMNEYNLSRKEVGTNKIADVNHFKAIKETERHLKNLQRQIKTLKTDKEEIGKELAVEQSKLSAFKARTERLDKIASKDSTKALKYADDRLKHVKPTIFNKDIVQIPKKDLDSLETAFKGASISNERVLKRNKDLESTNETLVAANKDFSIQNNSLTNKVEKLENKVKDLEQDKRFYEQVFDLFKPYLQKYHDRIQSMLESSPIPGGLKNLLKGFVAGTLADEDLSHAKDVALSANEKGYNEATIYYGIGTTIEEQKQLLEPVKKDPVKISQSKGRGMRL